ncbi:hypothetical protein ACXHMN_23280 [Rhizobium sp. LEGMi12c]
MIAAIRKRLRSYFWTILPILIISIKADLAQAEGLDLALIRSPFKLSAFPKSDNGKAIGMTVTLMRDALEYKAIKGKFLLSPYGKFDLQKMSPGLRSVYKNADGAFIYSIENWQVIADLNRDYLYIKAGQVPRYAYAYKGRYIPTGQPAIFICLVWNPDFENFYETAAGHMRCDAFKSKQVP